MDLTVYAWIEEKSTGDINRNWIVRNNNSYLGLQEKCGSGN